MEFMRLDELVHVANDHAGVESLTNRPQVINRVFATVVKALTIRLVLASCAALLLRHGASPNAIGLGGTLVLSMAVMREHVDQVFRTWLLFCSSSQKWDRYEGASSPCGGELAHSYRS